MCGRTGPAPGRGGCTRSWSRPACRRRGHSPCSGGASSTSGRSSASGPTSLRPLPRGWILATRRAAGRGAGQAVARARLGDAHQASAAVVDLRYQHGTPALLAANERTVVLHGNLVVRDKGPFPAVTQSVSCGRIPTAPCRAQGHRTPDHPDWRAGAVNRRCPAVTGTRRRSRDSGPRQGKSLAGAHPERGRTGPCFTVTAPRFRLSLEHRFYGSQIFGDANFLEAVLRASLGHIGPAWAVYFFWSIPESPCRLFCLSRYR